LVECIANIVTSSNLTAALKNIFELVSTLQASSSLSASVLVSKLAQSNLNTESSLVANIQLAKLPSSFLNAGGTLVGDAFITRQFAASLNGNGSLFANPLITKFAASSLNTASSLAASALVSKLPASSLTGAGTLVAELTVGGAFDADAQSFFDRVTTAGGTLTDTEKTAVNTLVIGMKADGIWTKMKAIYPMVGASAAACAQNLKSSSFTGTFSSGWTFASTGATPNGTSAFMNTGLNPVAQSLTNANGHLSYYCRTRSTTADPAEVGNFTNNFDAFVLQSAGESRTRFFFSYNVRAIFAFTTRPLGLISGSSTGGNTRRDIYINGVSVGNNTMIDNATLGNYPLYLAAANYNTSTGSYSDSQCSLASIGEGLSSSEMSNFYTLVQAFQTTLSRQV
jgi:hypothetical protein